MALKKETVALPLISTPGSDAGTDPKLVNGITVARNVHWDRQGAAEKRFCGLWEGSIRPDSGFLIAPPTGWSPLLVTNNNIKMFDYDTYLWEDLDDMQLSDISVSNLISRSDGYYFNVTYIDNDNYYLLSYMTWGYVYFDISYNRMVVESYSKSTGKLIDTWNTIYYDADEAKFKAPRPVKLANGSIYIYRLDYDTNSVIWISCDPYGSITDGGGTSIPPVAFLNKESVLDACLGEDGTTVFLVYTATLTAPFTTQPVLHTHQTGDDTYNYLCLRAAATRTTRITVFPFNDGVTSGAMCVWGEYDGWWKIKALFLDKWCYIYRSGDGAWTPLDVVGLATDYVPNVLTGIQYPDIGDGHTYAGIYRSARLVNPSNINVGQDQHEESTWRTMIRTKDITKLEVVFEIIVLFHAEKSVIASKPWVDADNHVFLLTTTSGKHFTLRNESGGIVGRCCFETAYPDGYNDGYCIRGFATEVNNEQMFVVPCPGDGYNYTIGLIQKEGPTYTAVKATINTGMYALKTIQQAMKQTNTNDTIFIPNSHPYQWDGKKIVEMGFLDTPRFIALRATTGGNMAVGKYWYQALFSWSDSNGALHRSAPSRPFSITLTAGKTAVTVKVPTIRGTLKENVNVEVYRTEANGVEPKLVYSFNNDEALVLDYKEFTDTKADSVIIGEKPIYTFGGVVESVPPPPHWVQCMHQSRHFVVDRENENTHIYYSKVLVPGLAIEHSDAFLLKVPYDGGRINALVSVLDRLVVMKQYAIYVFSGSGPDTIGSRASYSEPYALSNTIGCSNRMSVIETSAGIMFKATQGIMLLTKSLQLEYIGEPVKYWTENSNISSVVARKDKSCVIWFTNFVTDSFVYGLTLVYNYRYQKWSIWTGKALKADTACVTTDDRIWIQEDKSIRYSADDYYYDICYDDIMGMEEIQIPMILETGWLTFGGVGGFSRVYRIFMIGQIINDTDNLYADIAYDYEGFYSEAVKFDKTTQAPFDVSEYYGGMAYSSLDGYGCILEIVPPRQKCTAIRLRLWDDNFAKNAGWSCSALVFVVGTKPQGYKDTVTKNFTPM